MNQIPLLAALLLPLGLDTFAVTAAMGLAGLPKNRRISLGLTLTAFEAGMPIVGALAGSVLGGAVGGVAGWLAVGLIVVTGLLLLRPEGEEAEEEASRFLDARGFAIVLLGLSVSLDELGIGFSLGLLGVSIPVVVVWIAVQTFIVTQVGFRLGGRISERIAEGSERVAGVSLIALAVILLVIRATHG